MALGVCAQLQARSLRRRRDEAGSDERQVGGHDREVGELDRLQDQEPEPGPLEHGLGDDRERN
jgi:hypothetical protein